MKRSNVGSNASNREVLSRRSMLKAVTATAAYTALSSHINILSVKKWQTTKKADPKPIDAKNCILDALNRFPIVAIGERHCLQEVHDLFTALFFDSKLPDQLTDIVVEFGNALHQDIADRFVLENLHISKTELQQIWRYTIGGGVLWDAPVYEQFFLNIRAINWMRPPQKRIRVLLGDPPCDPTKIKDKADKDYVQNLEKERDRHYADIVEREVLNKGRRALLIAGSGHLLRGIQDNFNQPNAVTLLETKYSGKMFVVDCLLIPPGIHTNGLLHQVQNLTSSWDRPSCALLQSSWLEDLNESEPPWINSMSRRAMSSYFSRYGSQANAILYLGRGEDLTASRPDPIIYKYGDYASELKRLSQVLSQVGDEVDLLADGLRQSQCGPSWFER